MVEDDTELAGHRFGKQLLAFYDDLKRRNWTPEEIISAVAALVEVIKAEVASRSQRFVAVAGALGLVVGALAGVLGTWLASSPVPARSEPAAAELLCPPREECPRPVACAPSEASAGSDKGQPAGDCSSLCKQIMELASPDIDDNHGTISISYRDVITKVSSELAACTSSCEKLKNATAHHHASSDDP